jgi:hypothetical protein
VETPKTQKNKTKKILHTTLLILLLWFIYDSLSDFSASQKAFKEGMEKWYKIVSKD